MSILDLFASLTTYQKLFLLEVFIFILLAVVIIIYFRLRDKAETEEHPLEAPDAEGNTSMLFRYPAVITGKALHLQMNEAYFDAIFSGFVRGLLRAGYTLSDREVAPAPLLPGGTLDALAKEVERARHEFLTVLGTDIEHDITYQMQSGRAPKFLIQLVDSCERLGWKIVPAIRAPEEECANSFSALP